MIMTKEHKEVREWEYIRGRKEGKEIAEKDNDKIYEQGVLDGRKGYVLKAQAISKFKEKLKEIRFDLEVIALKNYPENTEENMEELDDRIKSAINKIDMIIDKTAQEMSG